MEPQSEKIGVLFFLSERRVRKLGSSPFFMELQSEKIGVLFFYQSDVFASSVRRLFLWNPVSIETGFFVFFERHLRPSGSIRRLSCL
jgi:hypothetical protein